MRRDRIVVVSTNPAVDVEWRVAALKPEEKNEVIAEKRWPGGKGINVSRWLVRRGACVELVLPLGGSTGDEIGRGLREEGIRFRSIPIKRPTRANVVVTTDTRAQYRLNPTWPVLSRQELRALDELVRESTRDAALLILSGALVRGAPEGQYASWVRLARRLGVEVFLDCDGGAFRQAVRARPFLVKPNLHELEQWVGSELSDTTKREEAVRRLASETRGWVVLSCGQEGAWMIGPGHSEILREPARPVRVRNTVGAGDAMLAGIAHAFLKGTGPDQWLRAGIETAARSIRREPG